MWVAKLEARSILYRYTSVQENRGRQALDDDDAQQEWEQEGKEKEGNTAPLIISVHKCRVSSSSSLWIYLTYMMETSTPCKKPCPTVWAQSHNFWKSCIADSQIAGRQRHMIWRVSSITTVVRFQGFTCLSWPVSLTCSLQWINVWLLRRNVSMTVLLQWSTTWALDW